MSCKELTKVRHGIWLHHTNQIREKNNGHIDPWNKHDDILLSVRCVLRDGMRVLFRMRTGRRGRRSGR